MRDERKSGSKLLSIKAADAKYAVTIVVSMRLSSIITIFLIRNLVSQLKVIPEAGQKL